MIARLRKVGGSAARFVWALALAAAFGAHAETVIAPASRDSTLINGPRLTVSYKAAVPVPAAAYAILAAGLVAVAVTTPRLRRRLSR